LDISFVEDLSRGDHANRRLIRHPAGGNRGAQLLFGR
jgi:hypothetical protein